DVKKIPPLWPKINCTCAFPGKSGKHVFYNQTWGSVCHNPMDAMTLSIICRQLGCGNTETLDFLIPSREGARPHWVNGIHCRETDISLWQCPSDPWKHLSCSAKEEAHITCTGDLLSPQLCLVDGGSRCAGRVEILHQHSWGTVCHNNWDLKDADVVCRQMGCGMAFNALLYAQFGEGSGPIWLTDLACTGEEDYLWKCPILNFTALPVTCNFLFYSLILVVFSPTGFVHLIGGHGPCSGRVEVNSGGEWIPVSDGNFTLPTAQVICAELGPGEQVWAEEFQCTGQEPGLWFCPRVPCPGGSCLHRGAVQVVCSGETHNVRLMKNGSSQCEGQVEMKTSGGWRTLCASNWNMANANVVCRQLGCGVAISTPKGAYFVEGGDKIWRDQFHCSGSESFLWNCPVTALGVPACAHGNTASVVCSGKLQLRLVDGGSHCAGRVEILQQGSWGSICDDSWDLNNADVVCRQLGCGVALKATVSAHFGEGSGPIWLDELNCTGEEAHVWQCPSQGWGQHNCSHKEDAGVICSGDLLSISVRLVNGGSRCAGRVEILYQYTWGTVCGDGWDLNDAHVVCRQMGCGMALDAMNYSQFGKGLGPIWLDELKCTGEEDQVWQCPSLGWGHHYCTHKWDAGVICSGFVRLDGGGGPCSGRVEVNSGGGWTPVHYGNFTLPTAQVICAELGCGKAASFLLDLPLREANEQVWAEEFQCKGWEPGLWFCPRVPCPAGSCQHRGAVQMLLNSCLLLPEYTEVRLMKNGSSQCEGQVEMKTSGCWRTLCASHWNMANANVVCRQLGCGVAISTPKGEYFLEGGDEIWRDRFHCSGSESFLWNCPVTALGVPACAHGNTASMVCSGKRGHNCCILLPFLSSTIPPPSPPIFSLYPIHCNSFLSLFIFPFPSQPLYVILYNNEGLPPLPCNFPFLSLSIPPHVSV
uniref:SRCR domain-containing protein n=1 Tax=Marmota marmota marmota TaxID=9994 RepID=A0A8C5ZC78_MARMA